MWIPFLVLLDSKEGGGKIAHLRVRRKASLLSPILFLLSFLSCLSPWFPPPSHPKRGTNEEMFRQVASWMMSLKVPALVARDWNESVDSSSFLSLLPSFGLWKLNLSAPTTHGKLRRLSEGLAIDHAVVNSRFLDHNPTMQVTHDRIVSDHCPLMGKWQCISPSIQTTSWPTPMQVCGKPSCKIPWECKPDPFLKWVASSFQTTMRSKSVVTSNVWSP